MNYQFYCCVESKTFNKAAKLREYFTKTEWSLELYQPERGASELEEAV